MEMDAPDKLGTEPDGSASQDYCCYCYKKGKFTDGYKSLADAAEGNISFWKEEGDKSDDEARARIMKVFPTLKRWKAG
jgi:hypothetical protein